MKAAIYRQYGGPKVVHIAEVPTPTPKDNEVLIRIHATTITSGDWRARSLTLPAGFGLIGRLVFGVFGPRQPILGGELSGVIEAVGAAVTRFKVGDPVFAFAGAAFGSHAEYRVFAEDGLIAAKPANIGFEEAAALSFGGTTALNFLRDKAGIKPGDKVLIVGASGSVGSAAVQIAKHFGAEVTGVCSTANIALVQALGADHIVDYTVEDFAQTGQSYDIILNTNGDVPYARCQNVLKPGGRLLLVLGSFAQAMGLERPRKGSGHKIIAGVASVRPDDLRFLAGLAQSGEFKPVIDRSYPLTDVAEAHAYVDTGRKRGNVVLNVAQPDA